MRKIRRELGMRFLAGFVTVIFLLTSGIPAFAEEPKQDKGYTYNLKQLMEQTEKNIEKVDEKLKEQEIEKENQKRETEAREHFEKGNTLYEGGKLKEAKKEWQRALEITKDPQMKDYVRDSEKKARKEELAQRKEQREKQRRLEAEQREKERLERERQKQLELEKKEKLRQQKEEKARLEREESEKQKQVERQKKEEERKAKEEQRRLEAEKKKTEQERLKAERKHQGGLKRQKEEEKKRQQNREKELERQEKERIKKSKKAIQDAKEIAKGTEEEPRLKLEDLTYKTERKCLDVLGKNPDDKEAFDNLVNLYLLKDELLDKAKELYKNKDYEGAIQEYNKVLLIEPENKKANTCIKRAQSRMK